MQDVGAGAGLTCCAIALMEHFQQPRFRALRAAMFAGLGLWGVIPAVHGYMLHHGIAIVEKAVAWDILMGVVYLVRPGCLEVHEALDLLAHCSAAAYLAQLSYAAPRVRI
jgi:hypothetical protein